MPTHKNKPAQSEPPTQEQKDAIKKTWADEYGVKQIYTQRCENLICGVRENGFGKYADHLTSMDCNDDHLSFWNKDGKPWGMVSQPYHLDLANLKAIVARAEKQNHNVMIRAEPSWYWPGHTLFVTFRIKE